MSEYTTIYLRNKNVPLLEYREQPSWEEIKDLSDDEINKIEEERKEYNRKVERSMGCELFYLTTTPSRELTVLPWNPSPKVLTKELLEEVIDFYQEEIDRCKTALKKQKEDIVRLEARILKANVELYDKINEDIYECNQSISFWTKELNHYQYLLDKFNFVKEIIDNDSNAENYELIYTKC